MSLTGSVLPWVLLAVALLLFIAVVMGWPSFSSRWLQRTSRALMVVLLNVAVLLYAGVHLNNEYQFYTSWQDLEGVEAPAIPSHHGGSTKQVFEVTSIGPSPQSKIAIPAAYPALPAGHGRMMTFTVHGKASGITGDVIVYLPAGYNPSSSKRYPVIEGLHGFPGHPQSFLHLNKFFEHYDTAVKKHEVAPAIIVIPHITMQTNIDTECVNEPGGRQTETWLASDVPNWVMTHFAASSDRKAWVTYGFSMGGWCATMLAALHPNTYGGAVSLQGYFEPSFEANYVPFQPNSEAAKRYDIISVLRHNPPPVAMWVLASKQDTLSYPTTAQAVSAVRAPTSMAAVMLPTGGHRGDVWVPKIPATFAWLGKAVPGFAPAKKHHRLLAETPVGRIPA